MVLDAILQQADFSVIRESNLLGVADKLLF